MRRFLSIAICSFVSVSSGWSQDISNGGTFTNAGKSYEIPPGAVSSTTFSQQYPAGGNPWDATYNVINKTEFFFYNEGGFLKMRVRIGSVPSGMTLFRNIGVFNLTTSNFTPTPPPSPTPTPTPAPTPTPTPVPTPTPTPSPTPPPLLSDTIEYDYNFGPEYEGMRVVTRDQDGNILEEYVVGANGLTITGTLTVEAVTQPTAGVTAILYRPGQEPGSWVPLGSLDLSDSSDSGMSVGSWIEGGPIAQEGTTYTDGGYTYRSLGNGSWRVSPASGQTGGGFLRPGSSSKEIPSQYGGGQWSLRNSDGGLVATGPVPSGGGQISFNGLVGPGESAGLTWSVQPVVTNQEGTPSFGAPVTLGPGSTTPIMPPPVPVPTPGTNVVVNPNPPPSTNQLTPINVEPAELAEIDDSENAVLEKAQGLGVLVSQSVNNLSSAGDNLSEAAGKLNGLRLNPVGSNCTFTFGAAQITLQTSGAIRAGLSLLILGIGAFGAARMIREAVQ